MAQAGLPLTAHIPVMAFIGCHSYEVKEFGRLNQGSWIAITSQQVFVNQSLCTSNNRVISILVRDD